MHHVSDFEQISTDFLPFSSSVAAFHSTRTLVHSLSLSCSLFPSNVIYFSGSVRLCTARFQIQYFAFDAFRANVVFAMQRKLTVPPVNKQT